MSNGVRIDFSKKENGRDLTELFAETGILECLRQKTEKMDLVWSFFG